MFVDLKPLKKGQWRPQLEDYKPVASEFGEFKTKINGEMITGFTKHRPNGRMKVYEDSNGDGRYGKGDQLIAKGRVEKEYRGTDNPLEAFEVGKVKQGLCRLVTEGDPVGIGVMPCLDFTNSVGDVVGRIDFVQTFPAWGDCPDCF